MKLLIVVLLFLSTAPAYGDGWEGLKAYVRKDTLLCDYINMERALILKSADDKESLQSLVDKGSCLYAPNSFYATVVKDASRFTEPNLVELMVKGYSFWAAMNDVSCCAK